MKIDRLNRADIEWQPFLTPTQYCLIDRLLYRSNLDGYGLHVRVLARECNMSVGTVSQTLKQFPFIEKKGETKAMVISLNYEQFRTWIVHLMNNDCSFNEPTKRHTKNVHVHVTCSLNEQTTSPDLTLATPSRDTHNEGKNIIPSVVSMPAPAVACQGDLSTSKQGIVHLMNNSSRYVLGRKRIFDCPLPKGVKNIPSLVRNRAIVNTLRNVVGCDLALTEKEYSKDGFKFTAIDEDKKYLLLTADVPSYIDSPKIQKLVNHFSDYKVLLWVANEQLAYALVKEKPKNITPLS